MNGKIKIATLFRWWLIIYALLETGVITGLGLNNIYVTLFNYFSPIGMFIIYIGAGLRRRIYQYVKYISKFIGFFFLFLVLEYIYTCEIYNLNFLHSAWEIFTNYYYWTKLLLVFPIIYVFKYDGCIERLLYSFVNTIVIGNLMRALAWIGKSFTGLSIFPALANSITGTRSGRLRYGACKMHSMAFDVALAKAFEWNKKKRFWITIALFMSVYQFYIANGRSQSLCYILSAIVCVYYSTQWSVKNELKYKFLFISLMIIGIIFLLYTGFFENIYDSFFSTSSSEYGSTENRLFAINYYFSEIKDKWFFGMGLLYDDSGTNNVLYYILRNPSNGWNAAYYEDLGLLGQFFNYGFVGIVFFITIIYRMFRIARNALKIKSIYGPMLITLFVHFITMTASSMSMFMSNTSLQLAIEIAIFEYIKYSEIDVVEDI